MTTEEYINFVLVIGNDKAQEYQPVFLNGGWQFQKWPCPALTKTGCRIQYDKRPETCRIYPFIKVPTIEGPRAYLDVSLCPAWQAFGEHYKEVMEEIT